MKQKIIVNEQLSPLWKKGAIISSAITVAFFIFYLLTEDPLWKGIFRFVAFLGFIGVVFSFLRLRDGQKKIQIEQLEEKLKISYYRKGKMLKEELFERSTIKEIYSKEVNLIRWLPVGQKGYKYFISFTDTKNRLGLFEYRSRNLRFTKEEATKVDRFTREYSQ